jgi:hypothetical protein
VADLGAVAMLFQPSSEGFGFRVIDCDDDFVSFHGVSLLYAPLQ